MINICFTINLFCHYPESTEIKESNGAGISDRHFMVERMLIATLQQDISLCEIQADLYGS